MRIAIAGFGLEGRANLTYFRAKFPDAEFTIFDENDELHDDLILEKTEFDPETMSFVLGLDAFSRIRGYDLVLRSPSIPLCKIPANNKKIWSATNEFFANCPASIIGVTGTKGKGTTATMTRDILCEHLQNSARRIHLLGNIGTPALEVLPEIRENDVVIFELSSFQLWDLEFSPHVAVILRIEADHLDVHENFADYVAAKSHIAKFQTANDWIIYYEKNKFSREIANLSKGQKIPYPAKIHFNEKVLRVPGAHYAENAKAAIAASRALFPEISLATINQGLANFRAMPHRLEFVREIGGVKYYDDNFSASWPSLDVAVKAFPKNPIILIAGGFNRGLNNYAEIAKSIDDSTVKFAILLGQTAPKIAAKLRTEHKIYSSLTEAISLSREISRTGDVVVMSPSAPSFDMWQNFYARGAEFQKLVKELK